MQKLKMTLAVNLERRLRLSAHSILIIGQGLGHQALFLASQNEGHRILGITPDSADARIANNSAKNDGLKAIFIPADLRDIRTIVNVQRFDAVMVENILHTIPKDESRYVVDAAKQVTAIGGLNAISGFLVDRELSKSHKNANQMFETGELTGTYADDPEWNVEDSQEDLFEAQQFGGSEIVGSHANLIARRLPLQPFTPDME